MVVVILGIVASIIVPQLGSRDDLKVAAAARMMIADLSFAQNRAITTQKKQYVMFVAQEYSLLSRDSDATPLVAISHPVNPGNYVSTLNTGPLSGVTITEVDFGGATILAFDELGSPLAYSGSSTTTLTSPGTIKIESGGQRLTISIEPYTGEMSVSRDSG